MRFNSFGIILKNTDFILSTFFRGNLFFVIKLLFNEKHTKINNI